MQTAKSVYPDYQDEVAFIAVDVDPDETAETIDRYAAQQGYPWEMAIYHGDVQTAFGVIRQPSKVIIDGDGVITFRAAGRSHNAEQWREALDAVTTLPLTGTQVDTSASQPDTNATVTGTPQAPPTLTPPTVAPPALLPGTAEPTPPTLSGTTPSTQPTDTPVPIPPTQPPAQPAPPVGNRVGQSAPDFTVTTTNGVTRSLTDFKQANQPVVLYFFSST